MSALMPSTTRAGLWVADVRGNDFFKGCLWKSEGGKSRTVHENLS